MKKTLLFLAFWFSVCFTQQVIAQKQFKAHTIAFYNLENLFDTINDPNKFDDDFTPKGREQWDWDDFRLKLKRMSRVIADIGHDFSKNAPTVIGLAEAENHYVLEELVKEPSLLPYQYGIVHIESPDERGIDVALLYQKRYFTLEHYTNHRLVLYEDKDSTDLDYTRDQLLVSGKLEGEDFHFIVNHWPSRRGGEQRSRGSRIAAGKLNRKIIDSLQKINPSAKIITMGDLNDDPKNESVKKYLWTSADRNQLEEGQMFNAFEKLHNDGNGTLGYRDSWNLFDQIIISKALTDKDYSSFKFFKAGIFNPAYLITKDGRYKGYGFRSSTGSGYTGGYSDHFPTYIQIIKEIH